MTRRKIIFHNDVSGSWIVSEEFNGDKSELERIGSADSCDADWSDFMEAMSEVRDLIGFLDGLTMIWKSYHSSLPGVGMYFGPRLSFAHTPEELRENLENLDEVWEVRRGRPGARLLPMDEVNRWTGSE